MNSPLAFPSTDPYGTEFGMSLRDYFAAKAMQGMLANQYDVELDEKLAKDAYEYADAMLEARQDK